MKNITELINDLSSDPEKISHVLDAIKERILQGERDGKLEAYAKQRAYAASRVEQIDDDVTRVHEEENK